MAKSPSSEAHAERAHATWAASSTARNWACSGALGLGLKLNKPDVESIHSARGTACHEIAERALITGDDAIRWLDTTVKTKSHEIEIDEELVNSAQEYVDYVRSIEPEGLAGWVKYEQRFSLASLNPPFDAGGTADAVVYRYADRLLEVVDLKNGMGVVDVEENKQLRTYALGALLANPGIALDRIKVTVVQPRAFHKSGQTIRSETFHVADLVEWTGDLFDRMKLSKQAADELETTPFAAWWAKWLKPGNHCRFCPAEGECPKQEQDALDAVGVWFDDLDKPQISNMPEGMTAEQLAEKLDLLDFIESWIKSVRRNAKTRAEGGETIPNYQLSETIGHRKWGADEDVVRKDLFLKLDLTDDEVFARKLKSPAQIEKVIGSKKKKLIENMWRRDVTGTNLVRIDKTTRPAVQPAIDKHFDIIED